VVGYTTGSIREEPREMKRVKEVKIVVVVVVVIPLGGVLGKQIVTKLFKEFHAFYGTRIFYNSVHKSPHNWALFQAR
jgi:hypothetical protein